MTCPLLPSDECRDALQVVSGQIYEPNDPDTAAQQGRLLLAGYRISDVNNPEIFVGAIAATLTKYPREVGAAVSHPVEGLPSRLKFTPTIAEVREACEAELKRLKMIEARAKWQLQERARREAERKAQSDADAQKSVDKSRIDQIVSDFKRNTAA